MKRRGFLKYGVALGVLATAFWQRNAIARFGLTSMSNGITATDAPEVGADICVLTPEQTSGPYFIKTPIRSNISEELPGLPLDLAIEVVSYPDCTPLEGVTVEIWHCDARGYYSGYTDVPVRKPFDTIASIILYAEDGNIAPSDSQTFMRGGQITNAEGLVEFATVFPGWYDPRVTHIHLKVSKDGETFLTTQLYFPDELVSDIYTNHPDYMEYGTCPYNLTNDAALKDLDEQTGVVLRVDRSETKLSATARFGIA